MAQLPHAGFTPPAGACCDEGLREAVHLYVDGELPVDDQARLFEHLSDCAACRRLLESVLVFRRFSRQESVTVPPAADDAFFQRLADHKARRPNAPSQPRAEHRAGRQWMAPAAVAVAMALFLTALLLPPRPHGAAVSLVTAEDERVELPGLESLDGPAIYVFYPGLTVEAPRTQEPQSQEAL